MNQKKNTTATTILAEHMNITQLQLRLQHQLNKCETSIEHMQKLLTYLDAIIYSCLPFILTFVFSFFTLLTLFRRRTNFFSTKRADYTTPKMSTSSFSFKASFIKNRERHLSKLKLTLMLMTFPLTYLLTTCPVFVIITLKLLENHFAQFETNFESELVIAKTLMYANNSFNVLLFILLGKKLRNDVIQLFKFKRVSKTAITTQMHAASSNGDLNQIEKRKTSSSSKRLMSLARESNGDVDFVV
jgi:hypothetical protein